MNTKFLILFTALLLFPFCLFLKIRHSRRPGRYCGSPLAGGNVMLLSASDSSLQAFTRTGDTGAFELKNQPAGDYLLRCTYFGYQNLQKTVQLSGTAPAVDLGVLQMQLQSQLLGEVEIKRGS
ncbi:MAG: carboxypeptidase regulatory-like domain-containing protein [Lewinellaceae bacterium]|nr:carboxypeptidase regulatory-like domain-containing protein [Lewinellaceae bacterium]